MAGARRKEDLVTDLFFQALQICSLWAMFMALAEIWRVVNRDA